MSEFLTVRISSNPSRPVYWLVWSTQQQEIIASGEVESLDELNELSDYAHQRPVHLIVDGQDVTLHNIDIPAGSSRNLEQVLPNMLEDDLAQDIERMHFAILDKSQGQAVVCGIERQLLEGWLAQFKQAGFLVKALIPDMLLLPQQPEAIAAMQLGDQWLIRCNEFHAYSLDSDWLAMLLDSEEWKTSEDQTSVITSYTSLPSGDLDLSKWQEDLSHMPMSLLARGSSQAASKKLNLLTGKYKPKSSLGKYWKVWQKVAVAAVFLIAVLVSFKVVQVSQAEAQAAAYRAESERIFRSVLVGKQRIPTVSYLKRQMNDEEARLSGSGSSSSFLTWVQRLPEGMGNVPDMTIQSLKFDGNRREVRLQGKSKDFQGFEVARENLTKQFSVELGQLNRSGTQVVGSFVLTEKE